MNHFQNKKFGNLSIKREKDIIKNLLFLLGFIGIAIFVGIFITQIDFDSRDQAAGKTIVVDTTMNLQDEINKAGNFDALFLKVGTYTTTSTEGFSISGKNIRLLGAGRDLVNLTGTNRSNVVSLNNANVELQGMKISGATKEGIISKGQNSQVTLRDVILVSNSGAAVSAEGVLIIHNTEIAQNGSGIEANGGLFLKNSIIKGTAGDGINIGGNKNADISNTIIASNKGAGVLINGSGTIKIENITVVGNNEGIIESSSSSLSQIKNTIVQDSAQSGIVLKNDRSVVQYSNSHNNKSGNYSPAALGSSSNNLSVSSNFISATDFHLASSSPLRDKGTPELKDQNGSRIDIGAYGGQANLTVANGRPVITSKPPKFAKPGQRYTYEIVATDPDGDALSYVILNSDYPKWIVQEGNRFSGTPSNSDVGFTGIVVVVTDRKGNNVVHPISINVLPTGRPIPVEPTPTAAPTSAPVPTPTPTQPSQQVPDITIESPRGDTIYRGRTNEIKWNVTNQQNVDKIQIYYSSDKQNFQLITTLPSNATTYNWDVSNLTPGKYILRVEVTDKGTPPVTIRELSSEFEIRREDNTGTGITITKITPADNDIVQSRRPVIQVEFAPDSELDRSKTYLKINGQNVQYSTTSKSIFYTPASDLQGNTPQVEVKLVTTQGAEAERRWVFTLPASITPQDTTPNQNTQTYISILGIRMPRPIGLLLIALIVIALLGLILFGVIKLIKTIREERQGNLEAEFTEYYDVNNPDPNAASTQTTTTTTTTTYDVDPSQYYAAPQGQNEYAIDQTQYNQQPVQTVEQTTTTTTYQDSSQFDPNQYNTQSTQQDQQYYQTDTSSGQSNNAQDFASSTSSTTYQASDMTQQPVQQDVTQTTTTVQTTTQNTDDEYIKQLKDKYNIDEKQIEDYKKTQDDNLTPPDPTSASRPPKKD